MHRVLDAAGFDTLRALSHITSVPGISIELRLDCCPDAPPP